MAVTDALLAVLNGAVGDHLARTKNGLATKMELVSSGAPRRRVVVLAHGLMCTEEVFRFEDGSDYGTLLARDRGKEPLYLRYNSGLSVDENAREAEAALARLCEERGDDLESILLLGYSMGGLVLEGALARGIASGAPFAAKVHGLALIGSPRGGAPLERIARTALAEVARLFDPYGPAIAHVASARSAGIKSLGDRSSVCGGESAPARLFVAGTLLGSTRASTALGDGLVPVSSATLEAEHEQRVFVHGVSHLALAHHPEVYRHVLSFSKRIDKERLS